MLQRIAKVHKACSKSDVWLGNGDFHLVDQFFYSIYCKSWGFMFQRWIIFAVPQKRGEERKITLVLV